MKSIILALATAVPQFNTDQMSIAKRIIDICHLRNNAAQSIENLFSKTEINQRYSVLPDFKNDDEKAILFKNDYLEKIPGTLTRNEIYIKEAPKLALEAAKKAIDNWQGSVQDITHIISVSCTGVMAPGIEFILQKELGMKNDVQRIGLNFMGCFGAFRALAIADAIAKENAKNKILVVCTELCSLHFQFSVKPEILIGNALFSDGAAAVIVGADNNQTKPLFTIEKISSHAFENSLDKMTWTSSDTGFVMTLSREIPKIIEKEVSTIVNSFLNEKNKLDLIWAIHPGGKAIVKAIENACNLQTEQTESSWNILSNYGNMSSATFLFVLKDIIDKQKNNKEIIGVGFGPGLSMEMILLK